MTKSFKRFCGSKFFKLIATAVFIGVQFFAAIPAVVFAQTRLESLELIENVALAGETQHVQGIEVDGPLLWLTAVDRDMKRGLLFLYRWAEKEPLKAIEIQDGVRFHPGGISAEGESVWIPVAEYVRNSTTTIQKRNRQTLELEFEFEAADHIGAIAVVPEGLLGANWDARDFYVWDKQGRPLRKFANPYPVAVQDMKFVEGQLVIGGLLADRSGVIDWLEWPSLRRIRRITTGPTDRGVPYTNEGMAIHDGKLWLLPEDAPSRLFVFQLRY